MSSYDKGLDLVEELSTESPPESPPAFLKETEGEEDRNISPGSPVTTPVKMDCDDFERLDHCDYPGLREHPAECEPHHRDSAPSASAPSLLDDEDMLQLGFAKGLHSTDRPLVTIDESSANQKSPASTPTPSDKQFTLLGGNEDEDDEDYLKNSRQEPDLLSGFCREDATAGSAVDDQEENRSDLLAFDSGYIDVAPSHPPQRENLIIETAPVPEPQQQPKPVETTRTAVIPPVHVKMVAEESPGSCWFHPSVWLNPSKLDPRVADLVYWRDVKKTGLVFGSSLVVLLSLTYFSLISVTAYLLLAVMTGTLSYRIYKNVLQAVQKSNEGHPFKAFLEMDLAVPDDRVKDVVDAVVKHSNCAVSELRRLFLVEDLVDSIKFAVMLWCFTYIGAWFNGLTLIILGFVGLFTLPKVYETYKVQIDHYVGIVLAQVNDIVNKIKAKIPVGKKPKEQ